MTDCADEHRPPQRHDCPECGVPCRLAITFDQALAIDLGEVLIVPGKVRAVFSCDQGHYELKGTMTNVEVCKLGGLHSADFEAAVE